ncbi:MAG: GntR family transcriptional regulator [Pseudomonadota bacterium]
MANAERTSQEQRALRGLRSLVLGGDAIPGERLSEPQLADRLGLSRTPIRAAIAQLIDEGLLERLPTGGCRVRSFDAGDVRDAILLRGVMEGTAALRAAEAGPRSDMLGACVAIADDIDAALGRDASSVDFDRYASLNDAFHRAFVALCQSDVIIREYDRITRLPMAGPSSFLQAQAEMSEVRTSLFVAQAQHRALLDAIATGQGARAEALAREHAHLAQDNLREVLIARDRLRSTIPGLALVAGTETD